MRTMARRCYALVWLLLLAAVPAAAQVAAPDFAVAVVADDSGGLYLGSVVRATITITNVGGSSAAGGGGMSLSGDIFDYADSGSCGATKSTSFEGPLFIGWNWNIASLAVGAKQTCQFAFRVKALPASASRVLYASTYANGESNSANNQATRTLVFTTAPTTDLGVSLGADRSGAAAGDTVNVTVTARNLGRQDAPGPAVSLAVPASLRVTGGGCGAVAGRGQFVWSVGALAYGGVRACTFSASVVATAPTTAQLTAQIADAAMVDPAPGNNSDSVAIAIGAAPAPGYAKLDIQTSTPGPVRPGDTFSYTLVLRNFGSVDIASALVNYSLPAELLPQSSNCNTSASGTQVSWRVPAVTAGAAVSCTIGVRMQAASLSGVLSSRADALLSLTNQTSLRLAAQQDVGALPAARQWSRRLDGAATSQPSRHPGLSADGKRLVFASLQDGLLSGVGGANVYLVDRRGGAPRLLNAAPDGGVLPGTADYPVLSGNGQAAAFLYTPSSGGASVRGGQAAATAAGSTTVCSSPPNGLFQTKCQTGTGGAAPNGSAESPSLSADGRYLAFCSSASNLVTGDANGFKDVFVTDQSTNQTRLVSLTASGEQGNGDSCSAKISGDGRWVVFTTTAPNLGSNGLTSQVVRKDLSSGALLRISTGVNGSPANADAEQPSIDFDGRRIAFTSRAANLESGVNAAVRNIWVYDEAASTPNKLAAVRGSGGALPNQDADAPALSCNGRALAFTTRADNLAGSDTNNQPDLYLYDVDNRIVRRAVAPQAGVEPNGPAGEAALDCEGNTMAFASGATNLPGGDANPNDDVFAQDAPLRSDAGAVTVDASFSGNWFNAGNDGHGFLIEALALPGNPFYVTWYVFRNGQPVFLQGVANASGNRLDVDMYSTTSTGFPVGSAVTNTPWGRLSLSFTDANTGQADWAPTAGGYGAGSFNLRRLTTPALVQSDTGQALKACYSGIWADPVRPGYGVDIEINDIDASTRLLTAYWYTYQPNGSPLWLVGVGAAAAGKVDLDFYQLGGDGAQFPPAFTRAATTVTKWGSASLQFVADNGLGMSWQPLLPGYSAGSANLQRLTALAGRGCSGN